MTTSCPNCEARLEVDYFTTVAEDSTGIGWTDYQRNTLPPFAPEAHEHRWQAITFLEDVRSVIQSCECGEARRVEVP